MKKYVTTIIVNSDNKLITLSLLTNNILVKKYIFKSKYEMSYISKRICTMTMLRWAICENIKTDFHIQNYSLDDSEEKYLNYEIDLLLKLISKILNQEIDVYNPKLIFDRTKINVLDNIKYKNDVISLGFSDGKDSICCDLLLKKAGYKIETFTFDFDDKEFKNDFHTCISIYNEEISDYISTENVFTINDTPYYQEEDMHIIYIAPILLSKSKMYYTKICCGIQWDMLSLFDKSITISESYESMQNLISFVRNMGFINFGIILPLSSISSFGVYRILVEEFGLSKLDDFNSCWVSNPPCGVCLKCKRVKFTKNILEVCINKDYNNLLEIINKNNIPIDYLFGSENIDYLIKSLNENNLRDISKDLYINDINSNYDLNFSKLI